jgi:aubergine-like protein
LESGIKRNDKNATNEFFNGTSALCNYNQKIIRLEEVDFAINLKSPFPNPKFKTYQEYYEKNYNVKFKYLDQFLVQRTVKMKKLSKGGEEVIEERIEHFPPELLKPTGLTDEMRSDFKVMKRVAEVTNQFPSEKFETIKQSINIINNNKNESLVNFKINMNQNKVVGYQMTKPNIMDRKGNTIPFKGDKIPLKEMTVNKNLDNWVFLYDSFLEQSVDDCYEGLINSAGRYKIKINEPIFIQISGRNKNRNQVCSPEEVYKLMCDNGCQDVSMAFFFVSQRLGKRIYKTMKKYFVGTLGIATQFFTSYNPKQKNLMSKFGNIVVQMSVKIGSSPWGVKIPLKDTVIFGADVYHDKKNKSVSALVSLFGNDFYDKFSTQKIQKKGEEIMKNMSEMVLEHLEYINKTLKTLPKNILFYRDGVSEGQISIIVEKELKVLINSLYTKYNEKAPKITMIIVTKRIDDRFCIQEQNRLNNCPGGIIIQDTVIKPNKANFFMVAQNVNMGTAIPTHYEIILNQCDFNLPQIQEITYLLTHLYYNWMGAVKVPAPVQYAHTCTNFWGDIQSDFAKPNLKSKFHYL